MGTKRKMNSKLCTLHSIALACLVLGQIGLAQATELSVGKVNNMYTNINHTTAFTLDSGFSAAAIAECPNFNGYAAVFGSRRVLDELVLNSFKEQTSIQVRTLGCIGPNNAWLRVYSVASSLPPPT